MEVEAPTGDAEDCLLLDHSFRSYLNRDLEMELHRRL